MIKVKSPVYISKKEYLFVLLLIFLSGNQAVRYYVTDWIYVLVSICICTYYVFNRNEVQIDKSSVRIGKQYFFFLVILFLMQTLVLGWNSFGGIVNFLCKIFVGCFVVSFLGYRFKHAYLHLIFYISIIDIIFWIVQLSVGPNIGLLPGSASGEYQTLIFFHTRARETIRNCGFFWEPGAYGCYLLFVPILFFNEVKTLFIVYKRECLILFIALISTMSTTTYLTFGIIILVYFIFNIKSKIKLLLIPIVFVGVIHLYRSLDFLSDKVDNQIERGFEAQGDFDAGSRLSSLFFDMYYIKKHPIVGNGLHERTRYSEHLYIYELMKSGELSHNGNGFSDAFANLGLMFWWGFIFIFFKRNEKISTKDKVLQIMFFIILLQGECLLNYPFALALPLMKLKN